MTRRRDSGALARPPSLQWSPVRQVLRWIRDPVGLLSEASAELGDCFTLSLADPGPMLVFSHPSHVAQILESSSEELLGGRANAIFTMAFGARNLLSLDGEEHARIRRALIEPFTPARLPSYSSRMDCVVRRHVRRWAPGAGIALQPLMQELALDVVGDLLFGDRFEHAEPLRDAVLRLAAAIGATGRRRQAANETVDAAARTVRQLCAEELAAARSVTPSALHVVLAERLAADGADSEAVIDQFVSLLIAGHETTATALVWAVHHMASDADALTTILREVDGVDPSRQATPFLDACILETLRLHPAFPIIPRLAMRSITVDGFQIEAGEIVAAASYLTHRHPAAWRNPERFHPHRFRGPFPDRASFYPFGGGMRRCLGMHLALLEMRLVLARTFAHWIVQPVVQQPPRATRRSLTLAPATSLRADLARR